MTSANDPCACGHLRGDHIYEEGACRPGFECEEGCTVFTPLTAQRLAEAQAKLDDTSWDLGTANPFRDLRTAMVRFENHVGVTPDILQLHPDTFAALNAQLVYMQTRRYRTKRYLSLQYRRAKNRFWKTACRHPARKLDLCDGTVWCTRCSTHPQLHWNEREAAW